MNKFNKALTALALMTAVSGAQAKITWSNNSVVLLTANDYLNPYSQKEGSGHVVTFANAASYTWGKSFFFVDRFTSEDKAAVDSGSYGELNVDFSLTGGKGFATGAIKDVYLATTMEYSANPNVANILGGASVRWRLPGYAWVDTGVYLRDNGTNRYGEEEDNSYHFAGAWGIPFSIAAAKLSLEGFIDVQSSTDTNKGRDVPTKIIFQPRLKLDVGNFVGKPGSLFTGVELDYRDNMYGVKGQDQRALQLILEANF